MKWMDLDWPWHAETGVLWSESALLYSAQCVSLRLAAGVPCV